MKLTLVRKTYTRSSTIGDLAVNGKFECYVLEDPVRPAKVAGETAIPAGAYRVEITHSPKFGRDLPLVENVPGFEGIRIHPGNTPADTLGCLLPGRSKAVDFVGESRAAFNALFAKLTALPAGEAITLTITEGGQPVYRAAARATQGRPAAAYRVLADPLRLRTSADAQAADNVAGQLDYGQIVSASSKARNAPPGWVGVEAILDGRRTAGLVQASFLEPYPQAAPTAKARPAARTAKAAALAAAASAGPDLYRVNVDSLNLRKAANDLSAASLVAALPRNQLVAELAPSNKPMWWEVQTTVHGQTLTGFVNCAFLAAAPAGGPPAADTGEVQVSEKALQMILDFEGMDQPSKWPGEASGISLGHGYDLGYHAHDEFMGDWGPYLTPDQLTRLGKAIGKTGAAAKNMASQYADIKIKTADADAVFMHGTLPKIKLWADKTFPGVTALPADAQGALVSLVYNRGTDLTGDRRREMREVRDTVADHALSLNDKLTGIAASIRSMKRLWPNVPGLIRRREAEAALVEDAA